MQSTRVKIMHDNSYLAHQRKQNQRTASSTLQLVVINLAVLLAVLFLAIN